MAKPNIWDNPKRSASILKEKKKLETSLSLNEKISNGLEEIETYFLLVDEDGDILPELESELIKFSKFIEKTETLNYLSGDNDSNNAFLSIHPGAGGTESQDWAEMLLRMFFTVWRTNGIFK